MTASRPVFTLREPADLLALVPYLLGFHPDHSLVVVVLRGRTVVFSARADLPAPDADPAELREEIDYLAGVIVEQRGEAVLLVAYGPPERADPVTVGLADDLRRRDVPVWEAIRALDGRYWSLTCSGECCPTDGTAYDITTTAVAATATLSGCVALPDRNSLVRQVAPIGGLTRVSIRQATDRATDRLYALVRDADDERSAQSALEDEGERAITEALDRQRAGGRLTDDEAAWLSVLLFSTPIRDRAWTRIDGDPDNLAIHRALWSDVMRRAEPDLVAAPGCLLAFTAWREGNGALAAIALDRVLTIEPGYSLASLLADALARGMPPSALDGFPWEPVTHAPAKHLRKRSSSRRARSRRA